MENLKQIYCDLFCLHDKVHTYHIRTVKTPESATLHSTLGGIYTSLEEIVDSFWENVIIKYLWEDLPSPLECYQETSYASCENTDPEEILSELYEEIEEMEVVLREENNKADNCLAQLISPIWDKFTGFCADLSREMCDD